VLVKISKARGSNGKKITMSTFRRWVAVTLHLKGPSRPEDIIRTVMGDVILDPRFAGLVYLKGLRVSSGAEGTLYKFGYNFAKGYLNRDRERLTDKNEKAKMLAVIWRDAVLKGGEGIVQHYLGLFRHHPGSPDILLADEHMSRDVAKVMWR